MECIFALFGLQRALSSGMLLEQGRSLLASAEEDPDALKKWLASIEACRAGKQLGRKDVLHGSNRKVCKTISKSRKTKSRKVIRFHFEFRKVDKSKRRKKVEKYTFCFFLFF